ncbi:MAG TPA: hypothetical protein PLM00_08925 [Spirochaetota bacterium]|nr:hypothetical protein [Spirochaetota bacterium]HPH03112.1 hypothetical protein [Spirochaetota bacterium]HPN83503.1 hypothetical protein [Spirochaetota bacterium]
MPKQHNTHEDAAKKAIDVLLKRDWKDIHASEHGKRPGVAPVRSAHKALHTHGTR